MPQKNSNADNFVSEGKINVKPFLDRADGGTLDDVYVNYLMYNPLMLSLLIIVFSLAIWKFTDIILSIYKLSKRHSVNECNLDENKQTLNQENDNLEKNKSHHMVTKKTQQQDLKSNELDEDKLQNPIVDPKKKNWFNSLFGIKPIQK